MLLPHEVLGVSPDADVASIKRVFRALVKETHPDRSRDLHADARLRAIVSAYRQLIHARTERAPTARAPTASTAPFAAAVAASVAFGDDLAWEDRAPRDMRPVYATRLARYVVAGTLGAVALFWITAFLSHI